MRVEQRPHTGGEGGAVLPVALFGMLVISLLVASALLTASSELVLSQAYQGGLRALHDADAAMESFVSTASFPDDVLPGQTFSSTATSAGGKSFEISLTALREGEIGEDSAGTLTRRDLFSVIAEPGDGRGRVAGALLETVRLASPFRSAIDAAATAAGDVWLGADGMLAALPPGDSDCSPVASPAALRVGADAVVSGTGGSGMTGRLERDTLSGSALLDRALSGGSLVALSDGAGHYFGPAFGRAPFSTFYGPRHDATSDEYRWGCPVSLVFACPADAASESHVIVIDAAGGEVELNWGHGQGAIIVRGGGARLRGDFRFSGLVLVEGALRVEGAAQIMGAAVSGEGLTIGAEEAPGAAGPGITFDGCSIAAGERALSIARLRAAPQTLDSPTFGWYEVVR